MSPSKEEQLWGACFTGDLGALKSLLAGNSTLNVNWAEETRLDSPLHIVCRLGRLDIVKELLLLPDLDLNRGNRGRATPFSLACQEGHCEIVLWLLADPRTDLNIADLDDCVPLWFATQNGHLPVVQHLLASGRPVRTQVRSSFNNSVPAQQGRATCLVGKTAETEAQFQRRITSGPVISDLLDEFEEDPEGVRLRLRRLPGIREHFVGHTFAIVVFFSDGLARLRRQTRRTPLEVGRFLKVCARLPLELQMTVCCRVFGSPKDVVPSRDAESGFQWLARAAVWKQ